MALESEASANIADVVGGISDTTQLPVLPSALPHLLNVLDDPDADSCVLAEIIQHFPSIAVRLIALVNSAWCAPMEQITSIERACTHLGLGLVRTISMSLAIMAPFNPSRCTEFKAETYWCSTFLVADGAARLAACVDNGVDLSAETARAAGLFHNLGLLWLADALPLETETALATARAEDISLNEALRDSCKTDVCQIGGILGRAWGLPEDLVAAMERRNDPSFEGNGWEIATLVRGATEIVAEVISEDPSPAADRRLGQLAIDPDDHDRVKGKLADKLEDTVNLARTLGT